MHPFIIATHWDGWWWFWLLFVLLLLVLPLGYGWGYRGYRRPWPPYGRREAAEDAAEEAAAWGLLGVFLWITFSIAVVWLIVALIA